MFIKDKLTTIFVNQQSFNTENNGFSAETALPSIESALSLVAEIRKGGAKQPISIKIINTEYFVKKPIYVDANVSDVTIEPYTHTKISGGMRIENFEADKFNGVHCISAQIPGIKEGDYWFTDFYVNEKAAAFTRYPENDFLYAKDVENHGEKLYDHSKWFIAEADDLNAIKDFRNFGDCFISFNHFWIDEHTPIESYDIETGKIVFKYISRFTITPKSESAKLRYIIENVAEAFNNPGEWYLDRPSGKVYYIPREDEDLENIVAYAPITDKLFVIQGKEGKKVRGITLRGFEFNCTKGDYRSQYIEINTDKADVYAFNDRFDGYASDIQSVCWAHGSIELSYTHGCFIENCKLVNMGVHAINIKEGCDHIHIVNNEIREVGAGGIKVDGGILAMPEHTYTHNVYIKNNYITRCGNRYFAGCGILVKEAYECEIAHNEISYIYYSGISCGWTWRYEPSVNRDNIIEKNYIHHLGQGKLSDMGGIYILSEQPGTIVRGNLIHDVESKHYGGWGIYPDEGSSYLLIENNICYNLTSNCYHNHYGCNNTVRNNIFVRSGNAPVINGRAENHVSNLIENNIIVSCNKPFFAIDRMLDENDKRREDIVGTPLISKNNLLFDLENENQIFLQYSRDDEEHNFKAVRYTIEQAQNEFGFDNGSIFADPMFVDFDNHDYRLNPESPAFKLGFKQIDMSDVGVIRK